MGELREIEWVTLIGGFNKRCSDLAGPSAVDSNARGILAPYDPHTATALNAQ